MRLRMGPKQQIEARLCVGKSTPRAQGITFEIFMESWGWDQLPLPPGTAPDARVRLGGAGQLFNRAGHK